MEEKMSATLESIQRAAMQEFLDKGFQGASLRQIVKNAGVTTGAFYGYFSSKEALFASLVEPHAAALMGRFMEAQTTFAELPEAEQPRHMGVESSACVDWMVDYKTAADMMQGAPISVNGNLDPVAVMLSGTVEEVEQKTRECIAAGNQTSLLAAGCEVPADTPEENLLAMDRLLYLS